MGYRVDSVTVTMEVVREFEGRGPITFSYSPAPNDPLVLALLDKAHELDQAAVLAAGPANPFTFG